MKKSAILYALIVLLCLGLSSAYGSALPNDDFMLPAIEAIKAEWMELYEASGNMSTTKHLEIRDSRIIHIKENDTELFRNADYVVEFVLFTDYFGSAPYYSNAGMYDSVLVTRDGAITVNRANPFAAYRSRTFTSDFSDIIDSIEELGAAYNGEMEIE